MFKRLATILVCLIMVFVATFSFVVGVVSVPTIYSYAETTNNFEPIRDQSDAVYAFQYYCKSRDLTIEGSISDAVTSYTTDAYNYTCNKIGVNPTELQAQIQAEYDQAGKPIKFLFSATGVDVFNRLFSQFLQDNELQVGDTNVNELVKSGSLFVDDNGNACYVFKTTNTSGNENDITEYGTVYRYNSSDLISLYNGGTTSFNSYVDNVSYTFNLNKNDIGSGNSAYTEYGINNSVFYRSNGTVDRYMIVLSYRSNLYFGICGKLSSSSYQMSSLYRIENKTISNATQSANVYIISTQINNNVYEGDTVINNEGDVIINEDPVPPGGTDPGWNIGGGEGQATDGNGNTWNITFPDFELPDLNIDWSIQGLGDKFPFSIPFDLVALVNVLNAEPEAPRFEGTVNFGFTTWDYDINLEQFDSVASACRVAELLLLVFGLILITRSIIKG